MCLRYLLTVCHYFEERAGNIELTSFCSLFLCLLLCLIFGWKVKVKVLVGQLCWRARPLGAVLSQVAVDRSSPQWGPCHHLPPRIGPLLLMLD